MNKIDEQRIAQLEGQVTELLEVTKSQREVLALRKAGCTCHLAPASGTTKCRLHGWTPANYGTVPC